MKSPCDNLLGAAKRIMRRAAIAPMVGVGGLGFADGYERLFSRAISNLIDAVLAVEAEQAELDRRYIEHLFTEGEPEQFQGDFGNDA
jgi:hypothetical protein